MLTFLILHYNIFNIYLYKLEFIFLSHLPPLEIKIIYETGKYKEKFTLFVNTYNLLTNDMNLWLLKYNIMSNYLRSI